MFYKYFSDKSTDFFRFFCDTKIFFGHNAALNVLPQLLKDLGATSVGVLSDGTVINLPWTKRVVSSLEGTATLTVYDTLGVESDVVPIREAISTFSKGNVDLLIAIGGGSVLDSAKVVAHCLTNRYDDIFEMKHAVSAVSPSVPLIAVPTTFGTGSEVNMYAHLFDRKNKRKQGIKKDWLVPYIALVDYSVMQGTPADLKYFSAVDAFFHLYEVLTLKREISPLLEDMVGGALVRLFNHLPAAVESNDENSHREVAYASMIAGLALNNARTGLIHSMAIPYALYFDIPHAQSLYPFFADVNRYNWDETAVSLEKVAAAVNSSGGTDSDFLHLCEQKIFYRRNAFPQEPRVVSVKEIHLFADDLMKDTVIFKENPKSISRETVVALYQRAFSKKENYSWESN